MGGRSITVIAAQLPSRGLRRIVRDGLVYGLEVSALRKNGQPALDLLESLLMASRVDNVTFKSVSVH